MKVLALNGSPRKEESNTERLMAPLLEGMRTAGAAVDYRYLEDYELHQCAACFGRMRLTAFSLRPFEQTGQSK